ncbi:MAG: hypothetical protein HGA76_02470 [Candidatus Firestonebacteria bacterium]|nr:hypothetical protein [Candidatus Firestonebacteria bacterium]
MSCRGCFKIGMPLVVLCLLASITVRAEVTVTAQDFPGGGKNRAAVATERKLLSDRLDVSFLIGTLAKKNEGMKSPGEPRYLYQEVDPVPLESYKVYTPWAGYFKQSMVFVLGRIDVGRLKIARWSVTVRDLAGKEIKSFGGVGNPPEAFAWNGRDVHYNPVAAGQAYIPELNLEDYYGARVSLPQRMFYLDQFLWEEPLKQVLVFLQDSAFEHKRGKFSRTGQAVIEEVSNLVNQQDAWVMEIECTGPDHDLSAERAQALKGYFARENLRLKNIRIKNAPATGEAMVKITSLKPGAVQAAEEAGKR